MKKYIVTTLAALLASPLAALAHYEEGEVSGWHMMGGWGSGFGFLGLLTWLVWLTVGILFIMVLVRKLTNKK